MAAKLTLNPKPTFKHTVMIPVPGEKPHPVEFTFHGKTQKQYGEMLEQVTKADGDEAASFMLFVAGWDVAADFTKENVEQFLQSYIGAGTLLFREYTDELTKAARGN